MGYTHRAIPALTLMMLMERRSDISSKDFEFEIQIFQGLVIIKGLNITIRRFRMGLQKRLLNYAVSASFKECKVGRR